MKDTIEQDKDSFDKLGNSDPEKDDEDSESRQALDKPSEFLKILNNK